MNNQEKFKIVEYLQIYVDRYESQNKAANSLKQVSSATLSQMLNANWDLIKDEMWRNVANQIGYTSEKWATVNTRDFNLLSKLLQDAQIESSVYAVVGNAGTGKSFCLNKYAESNKNSYRVSCNEFWNKKLFLQDLLSQIGRDHSGYTVGEMMFEVVQILKQKQHPELIFDEADKLRDEVLYFFITLYNQLEGHCAILLVATNHLKTRIERGMRLNKKGYSEIFSRIGGKFFELQGTCFSDIDAVCRANGIEKASTIKDIYNDCDGDLRRVKRLVHANLMRTKSA